MVKDAEPHGSDAAPNDILVELSDLLVGTWRVDGPGINGKADYQVRRSGSVLVACVDFVVNGEAMKVMQHITHDGETDTLQAHYMDSMGDAATYTWTLDHSTLRVSLTGHDSDNYFEATLNEDRSQYSGSWYYNGRTPHPSETIVYTRLSS